MAEGLLTLAAIDAASIVIGVLVGVIGGFGLAWVVLQKIGLRSVKRAEDEAAQIRSRATADAEAALQKASLDAERLVLERREKLDAELEGVRSELRETERRLAKREDLLDRKLESLAQKEESLSKSTEAVKKREERLAAKEAEADALVEQHRQRVLAAANLTEPQAREIAVAQAEDRARDEVARASRRIIEQAETEAKEKAREITLMAVQRFATETTSESTVRAVPIPSDEMKGRIIGREGRNIRAFEKAAGVDIIVDDTPGVIVVSCFDKIRQAVAVEALTRLVADGRMHPSRIEEIVERCRAEISEQVIQAGKDAVIEVKLRGLHPKIVEAMGKLHYRTSYGQNVLRHSIEVAYFCQVIADQLGLDGTLARRCGFLHDIGKAMDHEMEGSHPAIGMEFAKQHGEREPVLNAIAGHHADIPSTSFYTPIVMAADGISSARPGARRESMERYIQRLEQLQDIALSIKGVSEAHAIQAGREVRVMVDARSISDDEAYLVAQQIAKRVSEEMTFPGEIRVTVLRETRAIEFAR